MCIVPDESTMFVGHLTQTKTISQLVSNAVDENQPVGTCLWHYTTISDIV